MLKVLEKEKIQNTLKCPKSAEECRIESDKFMMKRKSPLPAIIAALDGMVVDILLPSK